MYCEDDLLPVSALQHLLFCPRQCALIHIEARWQENYLTAQGRMLHEKTHAGGTETRPGLRVARGLRIHSFRLGLIGQADVVEFRPARTGIELEGAGGLWQPFPVEHKRGRAKPDNCDRVQLCAQAICLEEMLQVHVPAGAIFYGRPRRREKVEFGEQLRNETRSAAARLHEMYDSRRIPKAEYGSKCKSCSLYTLCMPKITSVEKDIEYYLSKAKEAVV